MYFQGSWQQHGIHINPSKLSKQSYFHLFQARVLVFSLNRVNDFGDIRKQPLLKGTLPTQSIMPKQFSVTVRDSTQVQPSLDLISQHPNLDSGTNGVKSSQEKFKDKETDNEQLMKKAESDPIKSKQQYWKKGHILQTVKCPFNIALYLCVRVLGRADIRDSYCLWS